MASDGIRFPTGRTFTARRPHPVPVHTPQVPPPAQQREVLPLGALRPGPRAQNDYVENPSNQSENLSGRTVRTKTSSKKDPATIYNDRKSFRKSGSSGKSKEPIHGRGTVTYVRPDSWAGPVESTEPQNNNSERHNRTQDVIICPDCGKCRCEACGAPRPLPSAWLCNGTCLCSSDTVVDYTSCMCCVKGGLYLCYGESDSESDLEIVNDPCKCVPEHRCIRWSCMGVLAFFLPCLLCYWPLRGCVKVCERGYNQCHSRGCRCQPRPHPRPQQVHNKRLLESGC